MLGTRIASLRSSFGWSQAELAHRLNISPSTVGMYEQGRREPSMEMLVAISRVMGVTTEFLLTGRVLCKGDWRARALITGGGEESPPSADVMKLLTKEELLVLLTASLFGSHPEPEKAQ